MTEKQELDFIDWVVLPLCLLLLIPVCILAVALNFWDWLRREK